MRKKGKNGRRSDCPVSFGLDLFGDKWTLLILRDIMFYGRTRFSDFTPRERAATNILADRLHRLEAAGIIGKRRDAELGNQYVYGVTRKGKDLLPTLVEMALWGLQYDADTPAGKAFVKRIGTEKRKLAREMIRAIENGAFPEYRRTRIGIGPAAKP